MLILSKRRPRHTLHLRFHKQKLKICLYRFCLHSRYLAQLHYFPTKITTATGVSPRKLRFHKQKLKICLYRFCLHSRYLAQLHYFPTKITTATGVSPRKLLGFDTALQDFDRLVQGLRKIGAKRIKAKFP